jgi:adenylate cyclase
LINRAALGGISLTGERVERRLAAVLAADVAGYSRQMGTDEEGTLARLKAVRNALVDPAMASHRGRIVKTTGDGMLVEFASAVDAVRCAMEVQRGMGEHNASELQDTRIEFRIGIHVGDIIFDDTDIFGDSVNIAARLEGIAEPGGICISDDAHRQVRGKVDIGFDDMGLQPLKNIVEPMRAWRAKIDLNSTGKAKLSTVPNVPQPALPNKPSIVVLPFANIGADPEQEYFVEGLCEEIINALAKVDALFVIARNSAFAYKGKSVDTRQIARELGVQYVLEGSARKSGDRMRITAQITEAATNHPIWSERYDRLSGDIFEIQDDMTKEIVSALRVQLTDGQWATLLNRGTKNIEAWTSLIGAARLFQQFNPTNNKEAQNLARRATELDPSYSAAWGTLGLTCWYEARLGIDFERALNEADRSANRAIELDAMNPWGPALKSLVLVLQGLPNEAIPVARLATKCNPNSADAHAFVACALLAAGHFEEACETFEFALRLNPFCPNWYRNNYADALDFGGRHNEAIEQYELSMAANPALWQGHFRLAGLYAFVGHHELAEAHLRSGRQFYPQCSVKSMLRFELTKDEAALQHLAHGLRMAGLPEG